VPFCEGNIEEQEARRACRGRVEEILWRNCNVLECGSAELHQDNCRADSKASALGVQAQVPNEHDKRLDGFPETAFGWQHLEELRRST
jgi:hypothetical protein